MHLPLKVCDLGGAELGRSRRHPGFLVPLEQGARRRQQVSFLGALAEFAVGEGQWFAHRNR